MSMNDVEFLAWLAAKVEATSNKNKLRVKMKHITRIREITAGPSNTYSPAKNGGAIKINTVKSWIAAAEQSIAQQVATKIAA